MPLFSDTNFDLLLLEEIRDYYDNNRVELQQDGSYVNHLVQNYSLDHLNTISYLLPYYFSNLPQQIFDETLSSQFQSKSLAQKSKTELFVSLYHIIHSLPKASHDLFQSIIGFIYKVIAMKRCNHPYSYSNYS